MSGDDYRVSPKMKGWRKSTTKAEDLLSPTSVKGISLNLDDDDVLIRDDSVLLHDVGSVASPRPATWRSKMAKTACLALAFFALGLCIAIPGPTLLDLGEQVNASTAQIMILFASRSVGYLVGAVLGGVLFDCFDKQLLLFNTLLISAVATIAIPWCLTLAVMGAMFALQGLTMGALDTGGNIFCVRLWGRKNGSYLQTIHFAFGIGAFIAPLLATPFLSNTASNATQLISGNIPVSPFLPKHINATRKVRSGDVLFLYSESDLEKSLTYIEDKIHRFRRDGDSGLGSSESGANPSSVDPISKVSNDNTTAAQSSTSTQSVGQNEAVTQSPTKSSSTMGSASSTSVNRPNTENSGGDANDSGGNVGTPDIETGNSEDDTVSGEKPADENAEPDLNIADTVPDIAVPNGAKPKPVAATDNNLRNSFTDGDIKEQVEANKKNSEGANVAGATDDNAAEQTGNSDTTEASGGQDKTNVSTPTPSVSPLFNNGTSITNNTNSESTSASPPVSLNISLTAAVTATQKQPDNTITQAPSATKLATVAPPEPVAGKTLTPAPITTLKPSTTTTTPKPTTRPKTTTTPKPTTSTTPKPSTTTTTTPKLTTTTTTTTTPKPTTTTTTPKSTTTMPKSTTTMPKPTTTTTTPKTTTTTTTPKPTTTTTTAKPTTTSTKNQATTISVSKPDKTQAPNSTTQTTQTSSISTSTKGPEKPTTTGNFFKSAVEAIKHISKIQFAYLIIGLVLFVNAVMFLVLYCKGKRRFWTAPDYDEFSHGKAESCCFQGTLVFFLGLFFFCYVGIEVTYGALVSTFAIEFNDWPRTQGATVAAIFWGSMAVGRGFSIFLARCCGPTIMLIIDLLLMMIGGAVLSFGISYYIKLIWLGTLILGLGMSSAFPAAISWAEKYFNLTGKVTAVFIVGSALGQIVIPVLTGYLYEDDDMSLMKATLGVSVIAFVIFVVMQCFALKMSRMSGKYTVRDRNGFLPLDEEDDNMELDLVHFDKTQISRRRDRRGPGSTEYQTLISDLDDD